MAAVPASTPASPPRSLSAGRTAGATAAALATNDRMSIRRDMMSAVQSEVPCAAREWQQVFTAEMRDFVN